MEDPKCDRRGFLRQLLGRGATVAAGATAATALLTEKAGAANGDALKIGQSTNAGTATTGLSGSQLNVLDGDQNRSVTAYHNATGAIALETFANRGTGLRVVPDGGTIPMPPETGSWAAGSMRADGDGELWYCWEGGVGNTSGWTPISLVASFVPLTPPQRIYLSIPGPKMTHGQERIIDAQAPDDAFAVFVNVAVTQTTGTTGYLALFASDETYGGHSNLNWFGANQILANMCLTALGADGKFKVRCGTNGSTHLAIDLLGYYGLS
jgi:hypothetical protein